MLPRQRSQSLLESTNIIFPKVTEKYFFYKIFPVITLDAVDTAAFKAAVFITALNGTSKIKTKKILKS